MYTISMVILLVIATTLVQKDMSLVTERPNKEITVNTADGNAAGQGGIAGRKEESVQNGATSTDNKDAIEKPILDANQKQIKDDFAISKFVPEGNQFHDEKANAEAKIDGAAQNKK
jgi:hypothetical protein